MNTTPNDDGPLRFVRNWLMFDERRTPRRNLLRNFIAAITICLFVAWLLAAITTPPR